MFKWDRLLRKNRINKDIDYKLDESTKQGIDLTAEKAPDAEPEEYELVEIEIMPAKIICNDCGGITLEGLDFCDKCGGEL